MRYWYLKGGDVLGPLTPQEIANDADFSMIDALVCPEDESENESSWKSPQDYAADFGYVTGAAYARQEPQVQPREEVPAQVRTEKEPILARKTAGEIDVPPEETIHTISPFTAHLEDNLLDEVPAQALLTPNIEKKEPTALEEPSPELKMAEEKIKDAVVEAGGNDLDPKPIFTEDSTASEEEVFSEKTHTETFREDDFKIEPKEEFKEEHAQPQEQPEIDDFPETLSGAGEVLISSRKEAPPPAAKTERKKEESNLFSSMEDMPSEETADPFPFTKNEIFTDEEEEKDYENVLNTKDSLASGTDHTISGRNVSTSIEPFKTGEVLPTTNGKIISMNSMEEQKPKPKADVILILTGIMFLFIAAALFMAFFHNPSAEEGHKEQPQEHYGASATDYAQPTPQAALQGIDEGIAAPTVSSIRSGAAAAVQTSEMPATSLSPDMARSSNLTIQDGAIVEHHDESERLTAERMVKNFKLDDRRGTIEQYFSQTYSGYYSATWSANLLFGDTYIVDFRALPQPRKEPILYQFRINVKTGQMIGTNNITLNLLSK
ncbi:MAG: hypothetical protein LBH18_06280 [Spirochaetaceae bacterium]|jgi:hypothetical protein|nr:hypothetical protein [Spirochaetaceae bacterium]